MKKIIIGIHGLANKPEKEILKGWWETSIREGLYKNLQVENPELNFDLVYWRDLLYKYPMHDDEFLDFDPLFNDEPYREAGHGAIKTYDESLLDKIRISVLDIVGSGLDALKQKFNPDFISNWVLKKIPRDLAYYYNDEKKIFNRSGIRKTANQVLREELINLLEQNKDKEIMLIAHSMGSIIAYDALRDLGQRSQNDVSIKQFVTLGSPLGLPYVKDKIIELRDYDKSKNRVRTPSIVTGQWKNFADKKDPITLDCYLKDDFGGNAAGVKVQDDLVTNDYLGLSGKRNPHKSYGYLRTPEFSRQIADFLE